MIIEVLRRFFFYQFQQKNLNFNKISHKKNVRVTPPSISLTDLIMINAFGSIFITAF